MKNNLLGKKKNSVVPSICTGFVKRVVGFSYNKFL